MNKGLRPKTGLSPVYLLTVILFIFSFTFSACSNVSISQPSAPELIRPVEAAADLVMVKRGDIKPIKVAEGIVIPYSRGLGFLVDDAPILAVHVFHGQRVSEGDLLAELDMGPWLERLTNARAEMHHFMRVLNYENEVADIRIELGQLDVDGAHDENGKAMAEFSLNEFITRDTIRRDTSELDRIRIQARIDALEAQKDSYAIYAPFDGVIMGIESLAPGDYPSGRTPFLHIGDLNRLTVRALTEQTAFFSTAESIAAIIGDEEWPIKIIPYTLEEQLAFYYEGISPPARFSFSMEDAGGNPELYDILPEGPVPPTDKRVLIMTREVGREDVIIIPINAAHIETASGEDGLTSRQDYAFVDVNGGRERRDIKAGRRSDIWIEITEGLTEGEYVYVD